jgi:iron-sulfur cluster assembly protein CyaY
MMILSDQEFRLKSDEALEDLRAALQDLSEQEGFDIEMQDGVLEVIFEQPSETKFIVSPNAPMRQIWVSAMARGYKLTWSPAIGEFALNGESLPQLVERLVRTFLES